jgi:hypothetical protein
VRVLFTIRDNCLRMFASEPMGRSDAGRVATEKTLAAALSGEPVVTPSGLDRFTVERLAL